MPNEDTPTPGNGVVEIIVPAVPVEGKTTMPLDLPDGVGQLMMTESAANVQASNRNGRGVFDLLSGALGGVAIQNFKDIGVLEGRTASGVLATPLASPTVKTA